MSKIADKLSKNYDDKLRYAKITTHITYGLLLLSFTAWQLTRESGPSLLLWAFQCVPLLLILPGMKVASHKAYIWLCFILLVYFVAAVDGVFSPARAWIDFTALLFTTILFISAMLTSRWLQYSRASTYRKDNNERFKEP